MNFPYWLARIVQTASVLGVAAGGYAIVPFFFRSSSPIALVEAAMAVAFVAAVGALGFFGCGQIARTHHRFRQRYGRAMNAGDAISAPFIYVPVADAFY